MLRSDSSKTYIVQGKSTASPDSYLVEGQAEDVIPHIITKYQNKVKFMKGISFTIHRNVTVDLQSGAQGTAQSSLIDKNVMRHIKLKSVHKEVPFFSVNLVPNTQQIRR